MINDRDLSREKLILATDSQTQTICTRLGLSRLCHRFLEITFCLWLRLWFVSCQQWPPPDHGGL